MTVNLTVISVQITVSQLHAEQMENFLWICVSMKCASRHLLCVHNLKRDVSESVPTFIHNLFFVFMAPHTVCIHTCSSCVAPCLRVDPSAAVPQ